MNGAARSVCGAVGAGFVLLLWILFGGMPFAVAAVLAFAVGVLCFLGGPAVLRAVFDVDID